jgi:2-polyprenyl-3-methyl-5-hydroxy-6-metoxy-1,4-benzoquinol methylase
VSEKQSKRPVGFLSTEAGKSFSDADTRAAWNAGARGWDEFVETGADYYRHEVIGPGLLAACGPVRGLEVLDLGCGQGYFSRLLATSGARVTGIDLSDELIALARKKEEAAPLGIEYHVLSAREVNRRFEPATFDVVTACMAVGDMADVQATLRSAFEVLRPGRRMVFCESHPGTDTPFREWVRNETGDKTVLKIDRYFDSGPRVCHWAQAGRDAPWDTPYWRYTLAEWTGMTAEAGFLIRRLHEPRPTEEQVRRIPDLDDSRKVPYFLVYDLLKP